VPALLRPHTILSSEGESLAQGPPILIMTAMMMMMMIAIADEVRVSDWTGSEHARMRKATCRISMKHVQYN
jgi:acetyl/propionyl-CoA carboxylase alpha subunit